MAAAIIEKRNMAAMRAIKDSGSDGLVFPGAGGSLEEWHTGIVDLLKSEGLIQGADDFDQPFYGVTTGGRIDFVLPFAKSNKINMGGLAMWRIAMNKTELMPKWLSDFVDNYKNQYAS